MKQSHLELLIVFLAECIGTGLLLFIGCLGAVETTHGPPSHLSTSLGFGLAVMIIINIFGMVSGAHLNPVVTLGAYIYELVSIPVSPCDDIKLVWLIKLFSIADRQRLPIFSDKCLAVTWAMDCSGCYSQTLTMGSAFLSLQSTHLKPSALSLWSRLFSWWFIAVS